MSSVKPAIGVPPACALSIASCVCIATSCTELFGTPPFTDGGKVLAQLARTCLASVEAHHLQSSEVTVIGRVWFSSTQSSRLASIVTFEVMIHSGQPSS